MAPGFPSGSLFVLATVGKGSQASQGLGKPTLWWLLAFDVA